MNIAVNTDYFEDVNSPELYIKLAAEAGFSHLMWCHQWNTDFLYSKPEIEQIKRWLAEADIKLQDVHGTDGREKCWYSTEEYQRQAGIELVINRMLMLKELDGSGTLVMHPPRFNVSDTPEKAALTARRAVSIRRSLDELMPLLQKYDVKIALERVYGDNFGADNIVTATLTVADGARFYDTVGDANVLNLGKTASNRQGKIIINGGTYQSKCTIAFATYGTISISNSTVNGKTICKRVYDIATS